MPYKDPGKERACARRRYERITAERTARGMCPRGAVTVTGWCQLRVASSFLL